MMTEGALDAAGKIMTSNGSTVSNGKESAGLSIAYTRKE